MSTENEYDTQTKNREKNTCIADIGIADIVRSSKYRYRY